MQPRPGGTGVIVILWAAIAASACGAADEPVDPGDLELRDLLGVAPQVAVTWDEAQRATARAVLADGLAESEPFVLAPFDASAPALIGAIARVDDGRLDDGHDALGLVIGDDGGEARAIDAAAASAVLRGEPSAPAIAVELDPRAWPCPDAACDLGVLAALAADAAPGEPRVRVLPVMQLRVIATVTRGADGTTTLLVNPIVTAVGARAPAPPASIASAVRPASVAAEVTPPVVALPLVTSTWSYAASLDSCATGVQHDCSVCLGGGVCEPVWPGLSGMDACVMLDADVRNYTLLCANLAVSLSGVGACVAGREPSCAIDADAISSPSELTANARFVDNQACADALAACLQESFGGGGDDDGGGGCSCGSCDGCDCNDNTDNSCDQYNCKDDENGNNGCNSCSGNGGGCNGNGNGGSCSVARESSGRGVGLAAGLIWVFLPVPVGLLARRRARRRRARGVLDAIDAAEPSDDPPAA